MTDETQQELTAPARLPGGGKPRFETPLVPRNSISGSALIAVVAIMTFLASLTTGAVMLVNQAASEWESDVAREVTIQVLPAPNRDVDATVERAAAVARAFNGIDDVRVYSKEESAKLLEPWLGTGLSLADLPVPRLIVVKIASGATPDLPQLRRMLAEQVPGAMLDDHRGWVDRMRAMAGTAVAVGVGVLRAGAGGHGAGGDLRHARRDGDQQDGDRGVAFRRRQEPIHRRQFPAPLSTARPARRRHWRRRRDFAIRAGVDDEWLVFRHGRRRSDLGHVRHILDRIGRLCRCAMSGRAHRGGDGTDVAAYGQPYFGIHRLAHDPEKWEPVFR